MTAIQQAGDALYIPPLWWHGVIPLSRGFGVTTPVTWQSPPHVIAKCLSKIARGEIDMIGKTSAPNVQGLAGC
jgi:ribosomal protein L16 Arg81 hydroxylase